MCEVSEVNINHKPKTR